MTAYTDAVAAALEGMKGVSTGACPGCEHCMEIDRHTDAKEHRHDWQTQDMPSNEASFSWRACGICGTTLGGDRHVWHWISGGDEHGKGGNIEHESDACSDCVMFLANGEEPDQWEA